MQTEKASWRISSVSWIAEERAACPFAAFLPAGAFLGVFAVLEAFCGGLPPNETHGRENTAKAELVLDSFVQSFIRSASPESKKLSMKDDEDIDCMALKRCKVPKVTRNSA